MSKKKLRNRRIIPCDEINWDIYKIFSKKKNNYIIYRCKLCRKSRIKKQGNFVIKFSGHEKNCPEIKRPKHKKKIFLNVSEESNSDYTIIIKEKNADISESNNLIKKENFIPINEKD